ncbi:hypothetical protein DESUT3_01000 [Desulfuromonas versatilis]|uniref:Beta-ketoacyl synthase N-terminal domain-containing protein n=1 Tax=Desulfuromonas versatilis TaxID=2802975 RepID=A0ABM8HNI3_9BACT|nr:hypothetical protein [Desulfuromonas versatilis]BCR03031.1 hypothetical protein DESUT3_01000 [Desulfuromonas versatilis]
MIWPKKSSVAAPQPGTSTAAGPFPEIWVTGIGLICLAGDQPFALLGAVGSPLSGARPDPLISVPAVGQAGEQAVLTAPIAALEGLGHPGERMQLLAETALSQVLAALPAAIDREQTLVVTLVPEKTAARGSALNPEQLEIAAKALGLETAQFRFVEANQGGAASLAEACRGLAEGTWQTVLFGGVDSLVDAVTCTELALAGRIMTVGGAEGLVPGEGAAYLVLQAPGNTRKDPAPPVRASIKGVAQAPEPHAGDAGSRRMTGLATAAEQVLDQAGLGRHALGGVVVPFGGDTAGALEWHQATQKLWPPNGKAASQDGPALRQAEPPAPPEELQPHLALGSLGAAALPINIALACARFEFKHPKLGSILVCEAGDGPFRGAVLLQTWKEKR